MRRHKASRQTASARYSKGRDPRASRRARAGSSSPGRRRRSPRSHGDEPRHHARAVGRRPPPPLPNDRAGCSSPARRRHQAALADARARCDSSGAEQPAPRQQARDVEYDDQYSARRSVGAECRRRGGAARLARPARGGVLRELVSAGARWRRSCSRTISACITKALMPDRALEVQIKRLELRSRPRWSLGGGGGQEGEPIARRSRRAGSLDEAQRALHTSRDAAARDAAPGEMQRAWNWH